MARPPQVTRHIVFTRCICKCVDTTTGQIFGIYVDLPRIVTDKKKMLQKCRQIVEKDNVHVLVLEGHMHMKAFVLQSEIEFLHKGKTLSLSALKDVPNVMAKEEN